MVFLKLTGSWFCKFVDLIALTKFWKFAFPARGSTQVLLCLFPGVLWLWHFLYSVDPHPVSSLHIYTFVVSRAFMAGAASQAGDADSSRAPGLTSGLQGSMNVHRGALLLVPQWQCISSFVFYIWTKLKWHFTVSFPNHQVLVSSRRPSSTRYGAEAETRGHIEVERGEAVN